VKTNVLITAAFILLPIMTTNAQIMSTLSAGDQAAYFNFGLDPAVLTTFGYARGFEAAFINRHVTASAELSLPVSKLDLNDYRLKIGARASVINYNSWDFSIPIHLILRGTQNWMHTATNFGADITALFGYYRDRWFVNLEFGYDSAFMTKIQLPTDIKSTTITISRMDGTATRVISSPAGLPQGFDGAGQKSYFVPDNR